MAAPPSKEDPTMELHELLTLDVNTLSATEANLASRDIVRVMTGGGVTGADLQSLKAVLVECNRKTLPPEGPDTRTRVKKLIEEAEARGDARTASILADSLVKADAAELENEKRKQEAIDATNKYWADKKAESDAELNRRREEHIKARTQELLYAHGNAHDYTEAKAREQATREVVGRPSFQDLGETGR